MGENQDHPPLSRAAAPAVLAVVVNWNGKADLIECLASLEGLDYPRERCRVLVVDNGSADGSPEAVRAAFPRVEVIENPRNAGYSTAVNQGIERALRLGMDYVWILNNDVVLDADSLRRLTEAGQRDESIGVAGPMVYSYGNPTEIQNAGYSISLWTGRMKGLKCGRDIFRTDQERTADVDSVLGCANLVRTSMLAKVGPLRTVYDVYFEETDLNARARRQGFRVVLVRDARVRHKGSATMNRFLLRRAWLLLRNLFLFELFNARPWHLLVFIPYYVFLHVPYFLVRGAFYALSVKRTRSGERTSNDQ